MAKGLIICLKRRSNLDFTRFFELVSSRIKPDNAAVSDSYIYQKDGLYTHIYNPTSTVQRKESSFCLGLVENASPIMFKPKTPRPDGTFALFRANDKYIEILSDYTASRTIWYYFTESFFIASTSQRMILHYLGDFSPNRETYSWALSTGTLGPGLSWDSRLKPLTASSTILLDRARWKVSVEKHSNLRFTSIPRTKNQHKFLLSNSIRDSIEALNICPSDWALALSGGMDSRCILYYLSKKPGLSTITWGLKESLERQDSDAVIARKLAERCNFPHKYAITDLDVAEFSTMFARFLIASEGRIDHLSGYMDGLKLWSDLSLAKRGIIRGSQAFGGGRPVSNSFQARRASRFFITTDFTGNIIPKDFTLTNQNIPGPFLRKSGESLVQWRDRLWLEFRTPFLLAALDDIKTSYVEIINPLLCRRIVQTTQLLPGYLREGKNLFRGIVRNMFPEIPFATRDAIQHIDDVIHAKNVESYIKEKLYSESKSNILPAGFLLTIIENYGKNSTKLLRSNRPRYTPISRRIMDRLPSFIQKIVWWIVVRRQPMSIRRLALRALIIIEMNKLLNEDVIVGAKYVRQVTSHTDN